MKKQYNINDRNFIVTATVDCWDTIHVKIKEIIHPDRKFFKTAWRDNSHFFIQDYNSIEEGIQKKLEDYFKREKEEQETVKKINDFFKKS